MYTRVPSLCFAFPTFPHFPLEAGVCPMALPLIASFPSEAWWGPEPCLQNTVAMASLTALLNCYFWAMESFKQCSIPDVLRQIL